MRLLKRFNTIQGSLLLHELSFVLLILLTAGIGVSWVLAWQNNSQESLRLTALNTHMHHVRGDVYRQIKEVFDNIFLNDNSAQQQYFSYSQTIERKLNQMRLLARSENEQQQVQKIADNYDAFYAETRNYINSENSDMTEKQLLLLDQPLEQFTLRVFETLFNDFEQYLQSRQSLLAADQQRWLSQVYWLELLPILLALALLLWSRRYVRQQVLKPLAGLMAGARHIAQGEWQYALPKQGVDDLQKLTAAINQMAGELAENHDSLIEARKQAAMGELIPLVAHNIRNPLAGIRAAAQVTLAEEGLPDNSQMTLRDIIVAVDRLERWVTSLLMYLHPMQPHFILIRLTELTDNALSLIHLQLQDKQLTVQRQGWSEPISVAELDANLIEQTLCNLLQNAIEAAPEGTTITLNYWQDQDKIILEIADQGRGLQQHSQIEDMNAGGRKNLHYGLGLPFARRVINLHHGQLTHTNLQPGTRVSIQLPLGQPETD